MNDIFSVNGSCRVRSYFILEKGSFIKEEGVVINYNKEEVNPP